MQIALSLMVFMWFPFQRRDFCTCSAAQLTSGLKSSFWVFTFLGVSPTEIGKAATVLAHLHSSGSTVPCLRENVENYLLFFSNLKEK